MTFLFLFPKAAGSPCPSGWSHHLPPSAAGESGSGVCFTEESSALTFNEAWTNCIAQGGNLASITSQEEQDFIMAILDPNGKYIILDKMPMGLML